MRNDIERINSDTDLENFVRKFERLRAEGLTVVTIAQRCGISRAAVNLRLRMYRERFAQGSK